MQPFTRFMKSIRSPKAMAAWSDQLRRENVTIGFVPTMGALHDGHRTLIRTARLRCDALVVSIFLNPTQFAPTEDLTTYPRPSLNDRALCRQEGVDVCFEPTAQAMYQAGFQTTVKLPVIGRRWEGEARPDHFSGVATVVTKLFSIVRPDFAMFGQKDYQQAALVRQLVQDLNLGVEIVVHPTVRGMDGLAMSSRNTYLSPAERVSAARLYESLRAGRDAVRRGVTDVVAIGKAMAKVIEQDPSLKIDYLAVCDPRTLEPLSSITSRALLLGAVRLGAVRLIDNIVVTPPAKRPPHRLRP